MIDKELLERLEQQLNTHPLASEQEARVTKMRDQVAVINFEMGGSVPTPTIAMAKYLVTNMLTDENLNEALQMLIMARVIRVSELGPPLEPDDLMKAIIHVVQERL